MKNAVLLLLGLLCPFSGFADEALDTYYREHLVQAPLLSPAEKGSLAGEYGKTSWTASDLTKGTYSLPLGLQFPSDRGKMLYPLVPKYSPSSGISEWGMGISFDLSIRRFRVSGPLDFETDDFLSPWGRLIKGSDGAYYPVGLDPRVRVVFEDGNQARALHPDGTVFVFGGEKVIRAEKGTYAWYLTQVISPKNERMSLQYQDITENYLYLRSIEYGGSGDQFQYQVSLNYADLKIPFLDYRSTERQVLKKHVSDMRIALKSDQGTYLERYRYEFEHEFSENSPSFYLKAIKKKFATGATEAEQKLSYYRVEDFLEKTNWIPNEKLNRFLATSGMGIFDEGTVVDLDSEGLPSLEIKFKNYQLMKQTETEFKPVELGSPEEPFNPYCHLKGRRSYIKFRGPHLPPDVFRLIWISEKKITRLAVCSREGDLKQLLDLPGNWTLSENHRFVDLNQDGKPDLVKLQGDGYQILENLSTAEEIKFAEKPIIRTLNGIYSAHSGEPKTVFFQDLNGDGIPDLVVKRANGFDVWYGKGGFEFEKDPTRIRLYNRRGKLVEFDEDRIFHFLDLNGDGITDLIVTGRGYFETFFLDGQKYVGRSIPAFHEAQLPKDRHESIRPILGDFLGSGNTQALIGRYQKTHSLELNRPGVGLLESIDDGKGNHLTFNYSRAKPEKNIQVRPTLLTKFKIKSSGKGSQTYHYQYQHSKTHSLNGTLLGFEEIISKEKNKTTATHFQITEVNPPLLISSLEKDPRTPDINKLLEKEYSSVSFNDISYDRLVKESSGFVSTDGSRKVVDEKIYLKFYQDFCPAEIIEINSNGVLYQQTLYSEIPRWQTHLSCFPSEVTWTGMHEQSELDFQHRIGIDRDSFGNPLRLKALSGEKRLIQEIAYRDDFRLDSVHIPGKGITSFTYDPNYRLSKIHQSNGVVSAATYLPGSDLLGQLTSNHGESQSQGAFEENFSYDQMDRLSAIWNNLFHSSQGNPLSVFQYQYATATHPGRIETSHKLESSQGVAWKKEVTFASADGQEIGKGVAGDYGWIMTGFTERLPKTYQTRSYGSFLAAQSLEELGNESLFSNRRVLKSEVQTAFDFPHSTEEMIQTDAQNRLSYFSKIGSHSVEISRIENDLFRQLENRNSKNSRTFFQDEEGRSTQFRYDALGRVVQITLPQGEIQTLRYDAQGLLAETSRAGFGHISYSYWPGTDLVRSKDYFGNDQKYKRQIQITYDFAGRVKQELYTSFEDKTQPQVYDYFYDGKQPGLSPFNEIVPGQIGFLTAVQGPGFVRTMKYQADGKMSETELKIEKWKKLKQKWAYQADGSVRSTSYEIADEKPTQSSKQASLLEQTFDLDALGRLSGIRINGTRMADAKYNGFSQMKEAQFSNQGNLQFEYDEVTRRLSGYAFQRAKNSSQIKWHLDPRGHITSESFRLGDRQAERTYTYTASGMLEQEKDQAHSRTYSYAPSGLPNTWTLENGEKISLGLKPDGWRLIGEKNSQENFYTLDELGRVKALPHAKLFYGPSGRVERLERDGEVPITYVYDEKGKRLFKKQGDQVLEGYWEDGVLSDQGWIRPLKVNGIIAGVLADDHFVSLGADLRGSVIQDAEGELNLPSAYGERQGLKTPYSTAVEYASQGYDPDLRAYRMDHRDYDPSLKRFLTPDPLFLEQPGECIKSPCECNLYGYAKGNPVTFVDPTGKAVNLLMAGIGAAVGGAVSAGFSYHMDPKADPEVHVAAFVGGAISGAAAGFTLGMTTFPSLLTGAGFSGLGNAVEQGINMGLGTQSSFEWRALGTNVVLGSVISFVGAKIGTGFMVDNGLRMQGYAASDLAQVAGYRGMGEMLSTFRNGANEAFSVMGRAGALDFSADTLSRGAKWSLGAGTGLATGHESVVGGAINGARSEKPVK